jgi:hypothetical protein
MNKIALVINNIALVPLHFFLSFLSSLFCFALVKVHKITLPFLAHIWYIKGIGVRIDLASVLP